MQFSFFSWWRRKDDIWNHKFFLINFPLLCSLSRLCAGCDQTYHLTRRTQDRRTGWSHHSYCVKRRPWGSGVPTQEWTNPQVTRLVILHLSSVIIFAQCSTLLKHLCFVVGIRLKYFGPLYKIMSPNLTEWDLCFLTLYCVFMYMLNFFEFQNTVHYRILHVALISILMSY